MLGDCVYFNGQATEYFAQFYQPYEHYLAPIFAVPGNHDGDAVAPETSLDAFVRNFCATDPGTITPEAGESTRTAMIQPNVFWTLRTPLATIIGLYTNVPEGGDIHPDQQSWLVSEMMLRRIEWGEGGAEQCQKRENTDRDQADDAHPTPAPPNAGGGSAGLGGADGRLSGSGSEDRATHR